MIDPTLEILDSPADLTPEWLTGALGRRVTAVEVERVGSGQIGSCFRLHLTGDRAPATVLLKLPTTDVGTREMLSGAYRSETSFFDEIAPTVRIRVPDCLASTTVDPTGRFSLLLEDLAPAVPGDQLLGCSPAQAQDAAVNLAGLHGPRWCDPSLLELGWITASGPEGAALLASVYGPATETFLDRIGDLLSPAACTTLEECVPVAETWMLRRSERFGLVHGDYRLDNPLFPRNEEPGVSAVDWQTLSIGLPARDLAYLLGTGLLVPERREHERALVAHYHQALVGHGVTGYDAEQCWEDYRFAMVQGPLVTVFGCAYGAPSERGDQMFAVMAERSCTAIRDLGTLDLAAG